jgi:[protein-PII] uridylyltransferase
MSAVNPGFWTSWKAYLLRELYERTLDYLSGLTEDRTEYINSLKALSADKELPALVDFVQQMPERYIVSTTKNRVLEDYLLVQMVKESGFSMRIDSSHSGVVEMSISALDCPGLFSRVVGFLSTKGLNIVSGRIFTGTNGIVIDRIAVSNWEDVWWDGLAADLEEGLKGIIIDQKPVNIIRHYMSAGSPFDVFIELDNEASDEFSLVEIFSPDRLGLLYDISHIMYKKGVNIISARINTEAGLAQDLFYVQVKKRKIDYADAQELLSELWTILKGQE